MAETIENEPTSGTFETQNGHFNSFGIKQRKLVELRRQNQCRANNRKNEISEKNLLFLTLNISQMQYKIRISYTRTRKKGRKKQTRVNMKIQSVR